MLLQEPNAVAIRKGPPRPYDAVTPIPATANPYDITGEDDIGDALTLLAENGEAISMYASGQPEVALGRIHSVDPEQPHFVMELNEGTSLPPGKVTFVAVLRTAKLQFCLNSQDWKTAPGQPQLIPMVFPETCAVLNRRSSQRVETPLGANYTATFVLNANSPMELALYDFAQGGIGMRCAKYAAKGLLKGRKLRDVVLDFGPISVLVAEMEIRSARSCRSFLLGEQLHLGCMFTSIAAEEQNKFQVLLDQVNKAAQQR